MLSYSNKQNKMKKTIDVEPTNEISSKNTQGGHKNLQAGDTSVPCANCGHEKNDHFVTGCVEEKEIVRDNLEGIEFVECGCKKFKAKTTDKTTDKPQTKICANCGKTEKEHPYGKIRIYGDCEKFKPQNHSPANRIMSSDRTGSSLNSDKHQNNPPKTGLRAENSGAERDSDRPKPQNYGSGDSLSLFEYEDKDLDMKFYPKDKVKEFIRLVLIDCSELFESNELETVEFVIKKRAGDALV